MFDQLATRVIDDIEDFRTIASVMGFGSCAIVNVRVLVEPPKHLGRVDALVEEFARQEMVGLLPEANFGVASIIPTVSYDTMLIGHLAGQHGGLHRAGYGRYGRSEAPAWPELANARCIGK